MNDLSRNPVDQARYIALFFRAYHAAAQEAARALIPLGENAKKALKALEGQGDFPATFYQTENGNIEGSLIMLGQEVYDKFVELKTADMQTQQPSAGTMRFQPALRRQFWNRLLRGHVAFLHDGAAKELNRMLPSATFVAADVGILALDPKTLRPLGLAYGLSDAATQKIQAASNSTPRFIDGLVYGAKKFLFRCEFLLVKASGVLATPP